MCWNNLLSGILLDVWNIKQMIKIEPYFKVSAGFHINHIALGKPSCLWDRSNAVQQ